MENGRGKREDGKENPMAEALEAGGKKRRKG